MIGEKKGFTAIELLVSLAILSITLSSVYGLYMSFIRVHTKEGAKIRVQQNVRSSLDMMVRDIRMVGLDPELTGEFGIVSLGPQHLKFSADRDMDGLWDEPNEADGIEDSDMEYMEYAYDDVNRTVEMVLYKSDDTEEMRAKLVDDVTDLTFFYLDGDDATTSNAGDVRTVEIRMTIQKPAGSSGEISRTLIKRVKCRNLEFH